MDYIIFEVNDLINQNTEYTDKKIHYGLIPLILAFIPLTYLIPTVYVILKTILVYLRAVLGKRKDDLINPYVMFVIIAHEISTFFYMLSDYINFRIPSTGVLTSWCALQEPSKLLISFYACSIYFNYLAMMFPFLLAVVRLIPVFYPNSFEKISRKIVFTCTPLILLYPFIFLSVLIPARGVCRQYPSPFQFGAAFMHYVHSWNDMRSFLFIALNSTIWFLFSIVANWILYQKLRKMHNRVKSSKYQKAERSLTLTTVSMMISYLANTVFLIMYGLFVTISQYFTLLRPFGNDFDLVVGSWVFFLVHPAFKQKSICTRKKQATVIFAQNVTS